MPLDDTKNRHERMTEFALHDRALVNARIFRPLGRGAGSKLDDQRRTEDIVTVRDPALGAIEVKVVAPYPVGTKEEDILLVLLGLAGLTRNTVRHGSRPLPKDSPDHAEVAEEIKAKGACLPCTLYQVRVSPYLLLKELSADPDYRPSKDAYDELQPRLERLAWVGYTAKGMQGNKRWSEGVSSLLSFRYVEGDDHDKTIVVTFNERIARIMLGFVDVDDPEAKLRRWYAKINLRERFVLKSDVARMLHRLFSVWIDEPKKGAPKRRKGKGRGPSGEALPVGVDTLIGHVYGSARAPSDSALRMRRMTIRKALTEIAKLETWAIDMDEAKATAYVRRLPQAEQPVEGLISL